jgi:hypothetical protein
MVSLDAFFGDYTIEAEGRVGGDVRLHGSGASVAPLTLVLEANSATAARLQRA